MEYYKSTLQQLNPKNIFKLILKAKIKSIKMSKNLKNKNCN